jgi:hypothetical protein
MNLTFKHDGTEYVAKRIFTNPHRNLRLYPIDPSHVSAIMRSIAATPDKLWPGVLARPHPDKKDAVELAFGHHRIAAALAMGMSETEVLKRITITDRTSEQMAVLLINENSTQHGHNAAATDASVLAASEVISAHLLNEDRNLKTTEGEPLWPDNESFGRSVGQLAKNGTVGRALVESYLGKNWKTTVVVDAIKRLTDGGLLRSIIDRTAKVMQEKTAVAEEVAEKAEKAKDKDAPAKRKAAEQERTKSDKAEVARTQKAVDPTYDARCANLFSNELQAAAFHATVTSDLGRQFMPVKEQYAVAKSLTEHMLKVGATSGRGRIGAPWVREQVLALLRERSKSQKLVTEKEAKRMREESELELLRSHIGIFRSNMRSMISAGGKIAQLLKAHPHLKQAPEIGLLSEPLGFGLGILTQLKKASSL